MPSSLWCLPEELGAQATSEYAMEACKAASFLLWGLSGRKFSGYTTITEVYESPVVTFAASDMFRARLADALTYFILTTSSTQETRLRLRGKPVSVVSLVAYADSGVVIPADQYEILDHSTIKFNTVLQDAIAVTYSYGGTVPVAGRMAARTLASQFALLWGDDEACELPTRVTSIARQGVTFTILDNQDFIADLRTGVYAVDLFLKTVNPSKAQRPSKVFSPDIPRGHRKAASS